MEPTESKFFERMMCRFGEHEVNGYDLKCEPDHVVDEIRFRLGQGI